MCASFDEEHKASIFRWEFCGFVKSLLPGGQYSKKRKNLMSQDMQLRIMLAGVFVLVVNLGLTALISFKTDVDWTGVVRRLYLKELDARHLILKSWIIAPLFAVAITAASRWDDVPTIFVYVMVVMSLVPTAIWQLQAFRICKRIIGDYEKARKASQPEWIQEFVE